jgi:hypothetical protein
VLRDDAPVLRVGVVAIQWHGRDAHGRAQRVKAMSLQHGGHGGTPYFAPDGSRAGSGRSLT